MTTRSSYSRYRVLSVFFAGACCYFLGCGARSVMDLPEENPPTLQGTGGAPNTGGTAGTFAAAGGASWVAGGAGGVPATGGSGGTPATGGSGGMPATGGAGGGFIGSCAYPSCLWNLIRDCQVAGPCTQDESQGAGALTEISELCCSNGVNELVTLRIQGSRVSGTVAVTKGGSKCYDVSITASGDGNTLYYAWLDPSSEVVAKATMAMMDSSDPVITCRNGETMTMTDSCAPDGSQAAEITAGTCR